ncbi:MAG: CAP domain-containing protein [Pyrinomonadaceae bacterium]
MLSEEDSATKAEASRPRLVTARARRIDSVGETLPAEYAHVAAGQPTNLERKAFELINEQRRANGAAPLAWDTELSRVARIHSEEMARRNFFDHVGKDGRGVAERARLCGVTGWRALAENIAYNQGFDDPAGFAVERWLKSAKHRENLLRATFTHTAVGVAEASDGRVYFTQVFISR